MIKYIVSFLVAMGISGQATAHHTKIKVGWLIGFDELTDEIFLSDGKTYYASSRINFSLLVPGERFLVEFVETRSRMKITAMVPVPVMEEHLLTSVND